MSDPSPLPPGEDSPSPPSPELDPAGAPEEFPAPDILPDDGFGRPVDGSVLGSTCQSVG